ncbi:MAG: hypothetical protein HY909_28575 [Deltaproteobacteria bacterium]|nr:hypothetical protein [Deltaproteobacteria bacterium]
MNALPRAGALGACVAFGTGALGQGLPAAPAPPSAVAPGGPVGVVRAFDAVRRGDALLVASLAGLPTGHGQLRLARLEQGPSGLTRARPDAVVAPNARAVALAWDGSRGALAWVVPPPPPARPGMPSPPGALPNTWGRVPVGLPPSTEDPLGPRGVTGGDVFVQALDANGAPTGRPVAVFRENARAGRVAVALTDRGAVVAWTGASVTDDEIRGTVRVRWLDENLQPRGVATHSGFLGDLGDALFLTPRPDRVRVYFAGSACTAQPGTLSQPLTSEDPSRFTEPPNRSLMNQNPPEEVQGPWIVCSPMSVQVVDVLPDGRVASRTEGPPLARGGFSLAGETVFGVFGRTLAEAALGRWSGGAVVPWTPGRALALAPEPAEALPLEQRHPREGDATVVLNPIPAPAESEEDALQRAAALSGVDPTGGPAVLAVVASDHRAAAFSRAPAGAWTRLGGGPSAGLLMDVRVLDGPGAPWVLTREGTWHGPLRWHDTALPAAPPAAPAAPLAVDPTYARLFCRARQLRAAVVRFEYTAGSLAAQPEAPTDPRMPGILGVRRRLLGNWSTACSHLTDRARVLLRQGGSPTLLTSAQQLCQPYPELVLGVPVNPAL